jgi:hypothetical protein
VRSFTPGTSRIVGHAGHALFRSLIQSVGHGGHGFDKGRESIGRGVGRGR